MGQSPLLDFSQLSYQALYAKKTKFTRLGVKPPQELLDEIQKKLVIYNEERRLKRQKERNKIGLGRYQKKDESELSPHERDRLRFNRALCKYKALPKDNREDAKAECRRLYAILMTHPEEVRKRRKYNLEYNKRNKEHIRERDRNYKREKNKSASIAHKQKLVNNAIKRIKDDLMKLEQYEISKLREMADFINGILRKHDNPPEDFTEMYTDPDVGKPSPLSWDNPMEWERIKRSDEYIGVCGSVGRTFRTFADFIPWAALIKEWNYKNVKNAIDRLPAGDRWPDKTRALLEEKLKQKRMQREKENDLRSLEDNAKG